MRGSGEDGSESMWGSSPSGGPEGGRTFPAADDWLMSQMAKENRKSFSVGEPRPMRMRSLLVIGTFVLDKLKRRRDRVPEDADGGDQGHLQRVVVL